MTNKLSCETQMLNCSKEDLNLKRKMACDMEKSDAELSETINKVNKTMESIGDSIKQGFGLIAEIMKQTHHSGGLYTTLSITVLIILVMRLITDIVRRAISNAFATFCILPSSAT